MTAAACESGGYESGTDPVLAVRALCHELRTPVASLAALTRRLAHDLSGAPDQGPRPSYSGGGAEPAVLAGLAAEQARMLQQLLRHADDFLGAADIVATGRHGRTAHCPWRPVLAVVEEAVACADVDLSRLDVEVSAVAECVHVDSRRTQRVLVNLLENAHHHGPRHARIAMRGRVRGDRVRLSVVDGGAATPELLDGLARREPPSAWTGLGLWIVRHLVHAMDGSIRARNLDGGLEVAVTLPAARAGARGRPGGAVDGHRRATSSR